MANNTEQLARLFHDTYERLAPQFGYETRDDTKQFDPESANGKLMIAVAGEVLNWLESEAARREQAARVDELEQITGWSIRGVFTKAGIDHPIREPISISDRIATLKAEMGRVGDVS